jgi:hypothetical protein
MDRKALALQLIHFIKMLTNFFCGALTLSYRNLAHLLLSCYVAARVWEGERGLRGREKAGRGPFAHGRARGKGFPS